MEILPEPKRTKLNCKPSSLKVSTGRETLVYLENGIFKKFEGIYSPPIPTLTKMVKEMKNSKRKIIFHRELGGYIYPKRVKYALTKVKGELYQENLQTKFKRPVKIRASLKISPAPPKWRSTSFSNFTLGDLSRIMEDTFPKEPPPLLLQGLFGRIDGTVKMAVQVKELDRLKGKVCLGLHGTSAKAAKRIVKNGFDLSKFGQRGSAHGKGIYVTSTLTTARTYGQSIIVLAFPSTLKTKTFTHWSPTPKHNTTVISHPKHVLPLMWISF